jgi:hypothetical protein
MSARGQTRTLDNVRVVSVKLLIADSKRTFSYVSSGPEAEVAAIRSVELIVPRGGSVSFVVIGAVVLP